MNEDLIRPLARVTDPVGNHSSTALGWLGIAVLGVAAVAAICFFPAIIGAAGFVAAAGGIGGLLTAAGIGAAVGATGVVGTTLIALGAASFVAGAAAWGGHLFHHLFDREDGSQCSQIKTGSSKTKCEGQWVARIGDDDTHGAAKLKSGADKVLEGPAKKPVSRKKEKSTCGGKVLEGAHKTVVGGESVTDATLKDDKSWFDIAEESLSFVSKWTGLASLPLLGWSALRMGMAGVVSRFGLAAAERATFREGLAAALAEGRSLLTSDAARRRATQALLNTVANNTARKWLGGAAEVLHQGWLPASLSFGSNVGAPHIATALSSMTGMSAEASSLAVSGAFQFGPAAWFGWSARAVGSNAAAESAAARGEEGSYVVVETPAGAEMQRAPVETSRGVEPAATTPETAPTTRVEAPTATTRPVEVATTRRPVEPGEAPPPPEPVRTADETAPVVRPTPRPRDESTPSAEEIVAADKASYRHYDQEEVFDNFIDYASGLPGEGAPPTEGLSYTTIASDALPSVMENGLQTGRALGKRPGENADNMWFKEGNPFYAEGVTLVIPTDRLLALGGARGVGLNGQPGLVRVPHDAAPGGIPFSEFAVVSAKARGFVEPIWEPSWWKGGVGETPPAQFRPPGARTVDGAGPAQLPAEVSAPPPTAADAPVGEANVAAGATTTSACTTCGSSAKGQAGETATRGAVPADAAAAVKVPAGDKGSAWAEPPPPVAPAAGKQAAPTVPENAWPEQWPAAAPGSVKIASQQRVPIDQVTGAFQGEVSRAIVDQKMASIRDILGGGEGRLPEVKLAPDPANPGSLAVLDGNHTFQAYKELGFTEVPSKVYDQENGVPFLQKQGAIDPAARFGIDEMRFVDAFSGSPKQQRSARPNP